MHPTSVELVKWAMSLRGVAHPHYTELVTILNGLREYYRDRAIDGPVDNGLAIGAARGIEHIYKLLRDAPKLTEEMTRINNGS